MKEIIDKAVDVIKSGGIILYPTDTIWGIGCDPSNEEAVNKVMTLKGRDNSKSLIVLVPSESFLNKYVEIVPEVCYDLIDFTEKPLTIIYPKGRQVAPDVMADDHSIAIRITTDEICREIMNKARCGLVSTSANLSGQKFPESFEEIDEQIKSGVDYIVNLPLKNKNAQPSQIIKIGENGEVKIIRK